MTKSDIELADKELIDKISTENGPIVLYRFEENEISVTSVGMDDLLEGEFFFYSTAGSNWTLIVTLEEWSDIADMPHSGLEGTVVYEGICSFCAGKGMIADFYYTQMHEECIEEFMDESMELIERNSDRVVSEYI